MTDPLLSDSSQYDSVTGSFDSDSSPLDSDSNTLVSVTSSLDSDSNAFLRRRSCHDQRAKLTTKASSALVAVNVIPGNARVVAGCEVVQPDGQGPPKEPVTKTSARPAATPVNPTQLDGDGFGDEYAQRYVPSA